jgi:hypothetical protein
MYGTERFTANGGQEYHLKPRPECHTIRRFGHEWSAAFCTQGSERRHSHLGNQERTEHDKDMQRQK